MPGRRRIVTGRIHDSKRAVPFNLGEMPPRLIRQTEKGARSFTSRHPGVKVDLIERDAPATVGYSKKYADNWVRIFGEKKKKGKK